MGSAIRSKANVAQVDAYTLAVQSLAEKLGVTANDDPMPLSKFKSAYSGLLNAALKGSVQQISRGRERYVVLTEEQVIAMARSGSCRHSLADTLASIQAPSMPLDTSFVMLSDANQALLLSVS